MKKKILSVLLIFGMSFSLMACGGGSSSSSSGSGNVKEYDIEEFGEMYSETEELFADESEYLTEEELYSDKGYELYGECSKKTGLPFNEEISLRGKKGSSSTLGFTVNSSTEDVSIYCYFPAEEQNLSYFIADGENIVVNGIFSKSSGSHGCLSDVSITSPSEIDTSYKNNVSDVLANYDNISGPVVVIGEIDYIQSLDEFENAMSLINNSNYNFDYPHYDNVVTLKSDDAEGENITFMYDSEYSSVELSPGDKVAVCGYIESLMDLLQADGSTKVMWGNLNNVYEIYKF